MIVGVIDVDGDNVIVLDTDSVFVGEPVSVGDPLSVFDGDRDFSSDTVNDGDCESEGVIDCSCVGDAENDSVHSLVVLDEYDVDGVTVVVGEFLVRVCVNDVSLERDCDADTVREADGSLDSV